MSVGDTRILTWGNHNYQLWTRTNQTDPRHIIMPRVLTQMQCYIDVQGTWLWLEIHKHDHDRCKRSSTNTVPQHNSPTVVV